MKSGVPQIFVLVLFVVVTCVFASDSYAWGYYEGCLECTYKSGWLPSTSGERCTQVGDGEYGDGIECRDRNEGLGWECQLTSPYPCYNVDVSGGGGTGGGGGFNDDPGSGCQRIGGSCPAYCSYCP